MPILRLVAEGVGPFEKLDLDLSDGEGNPHLGPHILAGVNGSGKSTILRAIAWANGPLGPDGAEWLHLLKGWTRSRVGLIQRRGLSPETHLIVQKERDPECLTHSWQELGFLPQTTSNALQGRSREIRRE
jgi:hypothetical protein